MAKFCLNKSSVDLLSHNVKNGRIIYNATCQSNGSPNIRTSLLMSSKAGSKLGENIAEGPDLSDFIAGVVPR